MKVLLFVQLVRRRVCDVGVEVNVELGLGRRVVRRVGKGLNMMLND